MIDPVAEEGYRMPDIVAGLDSPDTARLLAYLADLELEVDRLRRQNRFIEKQTTLTLVRILRLCTNPTPGGPLPTLAEIGVAAKELVEVVRDLHDSPGYHPAHDQVVAIAVRPLAEQVFRWQQRLTGSTGVELRLELEVDYLEWFPARLRHILDNLIANALRHCGPGATGAWVSVGLRTTEGEYALRVTDNGAGPRAGEDPRVLELFRRAAPSQAPGLGAGMAVVQLLVEQSGGKLVGSPREGRGTEFVLTLPRYDLLDYLE